MWLTSWIDFLSATFSYLLSPASRASSVAGCATDLAAPARRRFAPFAKIVDDKGLAAIKKVFAGYARGGPDQQTAKEQGNAYLAAKFPDLSYIKSASRV